MRRRSSPRVMTLFVRYGTKKYPTALDDLLAFYARVIPGAPRRILVIDNQIEAPTDRSLGEGIRLVEGDNSAFEFSAWSRALERHGDEIARSELVHLVTDAFMVPYNGYLRHLSAAQLELCARRDFCLGHIDAYPAPIEILGAASQCWIRTCFFFLNPRALSVLRPFVSVTEPERFFSGDPAAPFRADAPLSPRYRDYITEWLGGASMGGMSWHSSFTRSEDNIAYFNRKALAILNEHLLGIRLRQGGVPLIDTAWLEHRMATSPADVPLGTPWEEQVRVRSAIIEGRPPSLVQRLLGELRGGLRARLKARLSGRL